MEEDGPINFKALRAKFQEEAFLAKSRTGRPAVAEKPRQLPPPGSHCSSVVSNINIAVENKTPVVPRVFFRDGLKTSGEKRPISFPPQPQQTSPPSQPTNRNGTIRYSLKDRYLPLVLPVLPIRVQQTETRAKTEHKVEPEPGKDGFLQTKIKKKGLLLPFKSAKASKVSSENGVEPTYADLTTRPCSAPGELPSTENGVSLQSDQSTAECPLSSPDNPVTPPPPETNVDSDNRIMSTLERAKKKFSRQQMLIATKAKNLLSPDYASRDKAFPSPPKNTDGVSPDLPVPPPVCLPHLAYISARPFFKATTSVRKVSPALNQAPSEEPLSFSHPELDAPEFPDFENSEMEAAEGEGVDITAPELKAFHFFHTPADFEVADGEGPQSDLSASDPVEASGSSIIRDVNLGSSNIIPLNPASFPEPINLSEIPDPCVREQWSQGEEAAADSFPDSRCDERHLGPAESRRVPEQPELSNHATPSDGGQTHPDVYQQDNYYETYDNIYEDVENINKFISDQNPSKRKGSLKKPYADNHRMKEEPSVNKWHRNPWGSVSGEHAHSAHNHVHSKEHHSPNAADHKEQKKKEKQRLEKEKKEQKEREKKENEMKKKFKVTGNEEPMYHARVTVASKVRKSDLPVKSGDTVSIIRTTNCPKGKWLARDASHKYGYISVMNVELNIKEMLELGKKAQANGRGGNMEGDTISIGSRSSSHPVLSSCKCHRGVKL
ncbi:uncharacterized protein [Brachyistius frenatus]|uniref:uncharacterized protein n=1 Tax=Brachyistius frenatus TaxID=100188 RepID=UPI0037E7C008